MEHFGSFCGWATARFFMFSENVFDPLIYYSHFAPLTLSLIIAAFVLYADWKRLPNRALFVVMVFFSMWVLFDAVLWGTEQPEVIMFVWSIQIFFDLLIYVSAAFFIYVFLAKRSPPLWVHAGFFSLFIPLFIFSSSRWNLAYFDLTNCDREAMEGVLWQYAYVVEILITLGIVLFSASVFFREKDVALRRVCIFSSVGVVLFLMSFSLGNIIGSFTEDWSYGQYGLFGLPVFSVFFAYLVVRYQILSMKLIATQVLIIALVILIGSQFFFLNTGKTFLNFILISVTFFLSILFGILLVRSVKSEVRRKEELQAITGKLEIANAELTRLDESKTEFISIASHQLRTPLTAIKGFVSLMLEGSYGPIPKVVSEALGKVYMANERLIDLVENLLNISRMESGRLQYEYSDVDVTHLLNELRDTFAISAEKKGLEFSLEVSPSGSPLPSVWIDRRKSLEVISNLIDNAIKYTSSGSVRVYAEVIGNFVRVSVRDTGIGVAPEALSHLFVKFSRGKDVGKIYANGTGLGLYVGKSMMEAQGGHIGVESEGIGRGSVFFVDLPRGGK